MIRAKGHFWVSTRPDWLAEFSLAGSLSSISPLGTWWASVPPERWPDNDALRNYLKSNWEEPWGDRRQEIVFIGSDIDWPALKAQLDAALVPDTDDLSVERLPQSDDPFPVWTKVQGA